MTSTAPKEGTDPKNPVRIYTDGIFDCFHYTHTNVLYHYKKLFPYVHLVVDICSYADTTKEKGKPIMTVQERAECVRHCKWADEVYLDAPWVCTIDFLNKVNCKYIAHDPEPYPYNDIADLYEPFKTSGRFLATKRTEGISTTDIIFRILKDYDLYVERSVRKGAKMEDINISKGKYFKVKCDIFYKKVQKRKEFNPVHYFIKLWRGKSNAMKNKELRNQHKQQVA